MNYFQLFGIEESFDVDLNQLSSFYQTLQKAVHPDRFAHASSQEQLIAVQKSAHINDAYQTLKLPLKRAEYLLTLRGVDMPNEQKSFSDVSFLMRQMELREMLADIKSANDVDDAFDSTQKILMAEYQQIVHLMQTQIAQKSTEANTLASDNLRKLKFYQKLNIEMDRLEDTLFDD
ncbi:MAG: co-chaperone HscB [Colwellia sp.]